MMKKLYKSLVPTIDKNIIKHYENLSLQNIEGELWKDITGFEDLYQVSNFGRGKSLKKNICGRFCHIKGEYSISTRKEIIKKQKINRSGYNVVNLSPKEQNNLKVGRRRHITVHRLVALAFIPNLENKPTINHKNGIKFNNVPENLEWSTVAENNDHAINKLHRKSSKYWTGKKGKDHLKSQPVFQYDLKGNFIQKFDSFTLAASSIGCKQSAISQYISKKINPNFPYKTNHAYEYHWDLK